LTYIIYYQKHKDNYWLQQLAFWWLVQPNLNVLLTACPEQFGKTDRKKLEIYLWEKSEFCFDIWREVWR